MKVFINIILLSLTFNVYAIFDSYYKKNAPVDPTVKSLLASKLTGEQFDVSTGKVSFNQTDIIIPGNSSLEVAIRRKFANQNG